MGESPRSLAAEANGCFMVGIQHGSNRIQGRGASVARDGGLPSDLLDVSNRSKRLSETEEVRRSQEARWLDNQIPIQAVHGQVYSEFVDCHAGWSRSGEEGVSGSRSRREGRDRCGAQTDARPADPVFRRAAAVRGGDGGVFLGASLGAGADRTGT